MENTITGKKPFGGINSNTLRLIACVLMLMDHMWATVIPGANWLTYAGRLAFPIFAFQIAEGFFHTSDVRRYAKRLFIFGLVAEIPFNLMCVSSVVYPFHQNVMFTLLIGLLIIWQIDTCRKNFSGKKLALTVLAVCGLLLLSVFGFVDYGFWGVVTIIVFYVAHEIPFGWILQLAGLTYINMYALKGLEIELTLGSFSFFFPTQGFAVLSLLIIWMYNGKKGRSSKTLQYGFYAFYPVHMLMLSLIRLWA